MMANKLIGVNNGSEWYKNIDIGYQWPAMVLDKGQYFLPNQDQPS